MLAGDDGTVEKGIVGASSHVVLVLGGTANDVCLAWNEVEGAVVVGGVGGERDAGHIGRRHVDCGCPRMVLPERTRQRWWRGQK